MDRLLERLNCPVRDCQDEGRCVSELGIFFRVTDWLKIWRYSTSQIECYSPYFFIDPLVTFVFLPTDMKKSACEPAAPVTLHRPSNAFPDFDAMTGEQMASEISKLAQLFSF